LRELAGEVCRDDPVALLRGALTDDHDDDVLALAYLSVYQRENSLALPNRTLVRT
jgi:hypothetical protein